MAQTFATNASEALVGAEGSHKLSWQQASSQLVTNPVIFTKVHAAKKNQKCIRMKINCAMQRQQTPTKQSKYHCMSKTSDLHANSYTRKENKKMIFAFVRSTSTAPPLDPSRPSTPNKQPQCSVLCQLKDDVNIIGYICKRRCQGQWRHLTWRTIFFSTRVSIINEQLLKWIRCPRVASILAPLSLPCQS